METTVDQITAEVNGLKAQKVPNVYGVLHQKILLTHAVKHTIIVVERPALEAQVAINAFCLVLIQSIAKIQNAG
jgi:hypothetical protein